MRFSRRTALSFGAGFLPFLALDRAAFAGTVVKVSLWDKGAASMDAMDTMMPMGMAMAGAMMEKATMGITVDTPEIPAGDVTFRALNESKEFYHGVVISPVVDASRELPYLNEKMMVDEEAAGAIARVKELRPHDSGSVTVAMQPGTYILYCNVAGHYVMGMWTLITVFE